MVTRRNLDETRRRILDAGAAMVSEAKYSPKGTNVSLIDACRRAGLGTAGSGYKIWANQEEFRNDLMRHALVMDTTRTEVSERLSEALAAHGPNLDLQAIIRIAANENTKEVVGADWFTRLVALWLAAATDDAIRAEQIDSQSKVLTSLQSIFTELLTAFGLEMRAPFTIEMITLAIAAETHGIAHYGAYADDETVTSVERATGQEGTLERWHLLGCVVEALVESFTQPVAPDSAE